MPAAVQTASHGASSSSEARRTPPVRPRGARRPAGHLEARTSLKRLGLQRKLSSANGNAQWRVQRSGRHASTKQQSTHARAVVTPCHSQACHVGVGDGWAPPQPPLASCPLKAPPFFRDVRLVLALVAKASSAWLRGRSCHQIQGPNASECRGREPVQWRAACLQSELGLGVAHLGATRWVAGAMYLAQTLAVLGPWRRLPLGSGAHSHIVNAHSHIVNITLATDATARGSIQCRGHLSRGHLR